MRYNWIDGYLLGMRGVTSDFQPVWRWIRYQVGGKMFAAICLDDKDEPYYINLKVDPAEGEFWRGQYADILPGYYSDKRTWISVRPDGAVPDELLRDLFAKAYRLMLRSFSKKRQREVLRLSCCGTACDDCAFYPKKCPGCNTCQGKVFHAPPGKPCPIYACCVSKQRRATCAECARLPCAIWQATRDPRLSQAEFEATVWERVERLRGV